MKNARKISFMVFLATATLFPTTAYAALNTIKCVQQGLQDAGHDPNGIDGAIGRGTKTAAASFIETTGIALPELTSTTATQWCRVFQGPSIAMKMAKICTAKNIDISGRQTYAGEWFEVVGSNKPVVTFGLFIKEVDGSKVTGHYAQPLYDPWRQGSTCTNFSGKISDDGALHFFTSNEGRIERIFPNIAPALQNGKPTYLPLNDWKGRYGNTNGWAASVPNK